MIFFSCLQAILGDRTRYEVLRKAKSHYYGSWKGL